MTHKLLEHNVFYSHSGLIQGESVGERAHRRPLSSIHTPKKNATALHVHLLAACSPVAM